MSGDIPNGPVTLTEDEFNDRVERAKELVLKYNPGPDNDNFAIFVDVEPDLNALQTYVTATVAETSIKTKLSGNLDDWYQGVITTMWGLQAAFALGYEQGRRSREIEDSLPDSIKGL